MDQAMLRWLAMPKMMPVLSDRSMGYIQKVLRSVGSEWLLGTYSLDTLKYRPATAAQWARGDVHTNTVENIWSLLKRSILCAYHKVSVKHLHAYLDELEWRHNDRDDPWLFRDTLLQLLPSENLPYRELVG